LIYKVRLRKIDKEFMGYALRSFVESGLAKERHTLVEPTNLGSLKQGGRKIVVTMEFATRKSLKPYIRFARMMGICFVKPPVCPVDTAWGATYLIDKKKGTLVVFPPKIRDHRPRKGKWAIYPAVCSPRHLSQSKQLLSPLRRTIWLSTIAHEATEAFVANTLGVRIPFLRKYGHVGPLVPYIHGFLAELFGAGNMISKIMASEVEIKTLFSLGQRDALRMLNKCRREYKRDAMKKREKRKLNHRNPYVVPARLRKAGPHKKRKGYNSTKRKVRMEEE